MILGLDGATTTPVNCEDLVPVAVRGSVVELIVVSDSRVRFETDARKYI